MVEIEWVRREIKTIKKPTKHRLSFDIAVIQKRQGCVQVCWAAIATDSDGGKIKLKRTADHGGCFHFES